MENEIFSGKILRLTTEQMEDILVERVYIVPSVHTILVTDEGLIRLTTEKKIGKDEVKEKFQAGIIEQNEEPLETAKRELLEELGLVAKEWQEFERFISNETVDTYRVYYIARGLSQVSEETDGEVLSTEDYTLEELYERAMKGDYSATTQAILARLHYLVQKGELVL